MDHIQICERKMVDSHFKIGVNLSPSFEGHALKGAYKRSAKVATNSFQLLQKQREG